MRQLFALLHSPGPRWNHAIGFLEQPGVEEHIAFMRSLSDRGLMVLGGPFGDDDATQWVGMALVTAPDAGAAERLALEDRSVASGLVRVTVRPWNVPMGFALGTITAAEEG